MDTFPDMNAEGWTLSDVEAFANKYQLKLSVQYQETTQYEEGRVISQSRTVGSQIYKGTSLRIVVAKLPEAKPAEDNKKDDSKTDDTKKDNSTSDKENS